ncbi:MAG: ribonuclease P protein component [Eubacterium sp.]|nr:ribonuclease P protein component [Eubacterium sp.]
MSRFQSLKKNKDFQRVYRTGRSKANRTFVMYLIPNGTKDNRVGISVNKKVGNSIVRHRVTRVIREVMRLHWEDVAGGYDIVVVARKPAIDSGYDKYERALLHLLKLHHIYKDT